MLITKIRDWFNKAKPAPTAKDCNTQMGVHFEEVAEMLDALRGADQHSELQRQEISIILHSFASHIKKADIILHVADRVGYLDALCDQIVTAVGNATFAEMDIVGGLYEIAASNDSKFDDQGKPILDENKKIIKGPNYRKPNLTPFV